MNTVQRFKRYLVENEKSQLTIEKYIRDVQYFIKWLDGRTITKEVVLAYKAQLIDRYAIASVNSMLSAVSCYLNFIGKAECRVKMLRVQRSIFCEEDRELSREEYKKLLQAAKKDRRLALLMQTIATTGIRISEHRFITMEAVKKGKVEIRCKGKIRTILLPDRLCKALMTYARQHGIQSGSLFLARNGKPMDRSRVWAQMKQLCSQAGVLAKKVFPHSLRHLFARTFYENEKDVVRLADILGHSSINTTRIYTIESGRVHRMQIEKISMLLVT